MRPDARETALGDRLLGSVLSAFCCVMLAGPQQALGREGVLKTQAEALSSPTRGLLCKNLSATGMGLAFRLAVVLAFPKIKRKAPHAAHQIHQGHLAELGELVQFPSPGRQPPAARDPGRFLYSLPSVLCVAGTQDTFME